jgi:hypothetical protein
LFPLSLATRQKKLPKTSTSEGRNNSKHDPTRRDLMSPEPIGVLTFAIGLYCLALGYRATATVFVVMTMFGAAAAMLIGSANIQPAHLFLLFLALATLSWRQKLRVALRALKFPQPGFWLACLVLYGIATGFFSPRLLARATEIIPLGVSEYPSSGGAVPLGPVSSNFTQAVYLTADLLCFLMIVAVGSTRSGFAAVVTGLICYAFGNVIFALLDLATSATGTEQLLQYFRNARYTFHDNDTVAGMKRIVGSWPEASAFAGTTVGVLGFTGTMWLCARSSRWTGPLSLASLILVVWSTSSTGLFAAPLCLIILYVTAVARSGVRQTSRHSNAIALLVPPIVVAAVLVIVLNDALYKAIWDYIDLLILSKSTSSSGVERGSWNTYAFQNFLDSSGLGVGLGTARTSSFPLALLSNVGVPGTIFFLLFAVSALWVRRAGRGTFPSDARLAARNGCLGLLCGSLVAGPTVDLGLLFFILAGLASCEPEWEDAPSPLPNSRQNLAASLPEN